MESSKINTNSISLHILIFMYIFNFSFFDLPIVESSHIVLIFLIFKLLTNIGYRSKCKRIIKSKYNIVLLLLYFIVISYSIIVPFIQNTNDFSFAKTLLHQVIIVEIGFMLFMYIDYKEQKDNIVNMLFNVFIIQAFIQLFSFISPEFKLITDVFRSKEIVERAVTNYGGYRGLAISGSAFFGLATAYAIMFYIIILNTDKIKKHNIFLKWIYIIVILFGALSAGRTSIFGIIFGFAMLAIRTFNKLSSTGKIKAKKEYFIIPILILISLGFLNNIIQKTRNEDIVNMYRFVDSFIDSFFSEEGLASTTSGNELFREMYFTITDKQFWLGDGYYSVGKGYYMGTDAGYMRTLLFFGIFGLLLLFIIQYFTMKYIFKYNKYFAIGLFLLLAVLQIKGEVIGFLLTSQSIIILINLKYALYGVEEKK